MPRPSAAAPVLERPAPTAEVRLTVLACEQADAEGLEMAYGPGGLEPLDSDDIDYLRDHGLVWMPPAE